VEKTSSVPHAPQRPGVGDSMPDLTLRTLDGQPFSAWSLRGKRALLFMWASW
jgi:hypothetical protein